MKELSKVSDFELRKELRRRNKLRRKLSRKSKGIAARKGTGCRLSDRDEAEKQRRGYVETGSCVRRDGSEKLVGRDWQKRKQEIWERGAGKCEHLLATGPFQYDEGFLGCKNTMHDPHHKVKRSKKRDDRAENLIGLCRLHHDLLDSRKIRSGKDGA